MKGVIFCMVWIVFFGVMNFVGYEFVKKVMNVLEGEKKVEKEESMRIAFSEE